MVSKRTSRLDVLLGQRLRLLRTTGNHSVMKLSLSIGCSPATYLQLEDGGVRITAAQLVALSEAMSTSVVHFYYALLDVFEGP